MKKIICISGKDETWKDTVADILREELRGEGQRVLIARLADPLRHICRDWFKWDDKKGPAGLLQCIGTDLVRAQNPDFWVDFTAGLIAAIRDRWDYVIIPDCRFKNELDLERYGFTPLHLRADGPRERQAETELDSVEPDERLANHTLCDELFDEVRAFAKTLLAGEGT